MAASTQERMSGERRKVALLDAAITEFGRGGFSGTTTSTIATRAGCSEAMLYKHFADKEALLRSALVRSEELAEAEIDQALTSGGDPFEGWRAYVETSDLHNYRRMITMRMLCATFPMDSVTTELLQAGTERLVGRLRLEHLANTD